MFHSAALKLTVWYLAIIMTISLVFSLSLYNVSKIDLVRNVNRQIGYFTNLLGPDESFNYRQLRSRQLGEDLRHLKTNLFIFNLLVLMSGGVASYWLARRTLEPIEQTMEGQARFASDASHELRTPLTVMITENEVALRSKNLTKAGAAQIIKSNLEEAVKLKSLAEGLLRLTTSGGKIENPQPVTVKQAIDEAISRHNKAAAFKKIKISNGIENLKVSGDKDSLTELFSIFLDNAIKYTPSGGSVNFSGRRRHKDVLVQITDSGQGIKKTDLAKIFDRFYQADSSRHKSSDGGYGLGLAIAKKIAEAHHGHIEVTSTLGRGSVFILILPAA
ncbi:HAMP domain-containing histidine kinase [Candidatus Saccharibacteria bacterium]|nr:HAMP domain-containing histidine kinase [Candidatus Saccharibacteria bacterium]